MQSIVNEPSWSRKLRLVNHRIADVTRLSASSRWLIVTAACRKKCTWSFTPTISRRPRREARNTSHGSFALYAIAPCPGKKIISQKINFRRWEMYICVCLCVFYSRIRDECVIPSILHQSGRIWVDVSILLDVDIYDEHRNTHTHARFTFIYTCSFATYPLWDFRWYANMPLTHEIYSPCIWFWTAFTRSDRDG